MRKFLAPGLIFILCLSVSLLVNMPLVHILAKVEIPNQIRLASVQGTLLSGNIDALEVNGLQASHLHYQNDLGCLLRLHLCFQLDFDQGLGRVSADLLNQNLTFSDTRISYPMEEIATLFPGLLVKPSGELEILIENLNLIQQKLALKSGEVIWKHAGVVGDPIDLGEYRLTVNSAKQSYQFKLSDNKALLKVDGKGQIKSGGQYSLNVNIEAEPGLQQSIKSALEFIAKKRGLNKYTVNRTGHLSLQLLSQLDFEES